MSTRLGRMGRLALALAALGAAADETDIRKTLEENVPHLTVTRISPSPVPGIHEVEVEERGAVFYVAADGSHVIAGDMYVLTGDGLRSITEVRRQERRRELLADLDVGDMVVFAPEGTPKAILHVFTDVDCPYCRKLHQEVVALNGYGIEVRYLAYPRAGIDSEAFERMVSAWCSEDPPTALTELKLGNPIPVLACENAVAEQRALGDAMGVEGTPTLVALDGTLIEGYLQAAEVAERLDIRAQEH